MVDAEFLALYRGRSVAEARLVAVTAEPEIISRFVRQLTGQIESSDECNIADDDKPLRLVKGEEE